MEKENELPKVEISFDKNLEWVRKRFDESDQMLGSLSIELNRQGNAIRRIQSEGFILGAVQLSERGTLEYREREEDYRFPWLPLIILLICAAVMWARIYAESEGE